MPTTQNQSGDGIVAMLYTPANRKKAPTIRARRRFALRAMRAAVPPPANAPRRPGDEDERHVDGREVPGLDRRPVGRHPLGQGKQRDGRDLNEADHDAADDEAGGNGENGAQHELSFIRFRRLPANSRIDAGRVSTIRGRLP